MTEESWPPPVRGTSEAPAPRPETPPARETPPVAPIARHERYRDADYEAPDTADEPETPRQRGKLLVPILAGLLALSVLAAATFAILWGQSSTIEAEDVNTF